MIRRKERLRRRDESFVPLTGSTPSQTSSHLATRMHKRGRGRTSDSEDDDDEKTERRLEAMVFGDERILVDRLLFKSIEKDSSEEEDREEGPGDVGLVRKLERKPVWIDEDDKLETVDVADNKRLRKLRKTEEEHTLDGSTFSERLRTQFEKLAGTPSWAKLPTKQEDNDEDDDEDEDDVLLKRTGKLLSTGTETLPRGIINIKSIKAANWEKPAKAVIQAVEFHPSSYVLLVGGFHKTLDLFQIDGRDNPHIQGVYFRDFPIHCAHFTPDGEQIVVTSRTRHFYVYDMISGKTLHVPVISGRKERSFSKFIVSPDNKYLAFLGYDGYIVLISNRSKQWIANLKMNGMVTAATFSPDGSLLLSHGSDGVVYIWDMSTRDCIHTFIDDGCISGTSLSLSLNNQYIACGSDSGVVNVYNDSCLRQRTPKPIKAVMNLTTSIQHTRFNQTGEILAFSSKLMKNGVRLLHVPSLTVFSNWPNTSVPLNHVNSFDFSPRSKYLAVGNDKGKALLFRLNHYIDT